MEIVASYPAFQAGVMKFDRWLDEQLSKLDRGAAARLAKELDISTDKISKMRSGKRQPQATELKAIEAFFNSRVPSGSAMSASALSVPVVGYVGEGAYAHRYAVTQGNLDHVAAPMGATLETVAVEIRGDSLGEMFDRWLVFYDDVRAPVTDDLIGRLCVVGLPDDQVLIKKIRRNKTPGLFDLISERADPIRNVRVAWAARVKIMTPK